MKERVKSRIHLFATDVKYTYYSLAAGDMTCITKGDRIALIAGFMAAVFYVATVGCFAEGDGLISKIGETASGIYGELGKSLIKIAGLAAGICIVWFFCCASDEDAKRPIKWFKRIIAGLIGFLILGAFFKFIETKTTGMGFNDVYGTGK